MRLLISICLMLGLLGCAATRVADVPEPAPDSEDAIDVFSAATTIQDQWQHYPVHGSTAYRLVAVDGRVAIRATGQESASGLYRDVLINPNECPTLEWEWAVRKLQAHADLATRAGDDVAASIFVLFGDPGPAWEPRPVPTLRYVWTNERARPGDIIANPYMPEMVRNVVVESGYLDASMWVSERRNLLDDFEAAFGHPPEDAIHGVLLFTDNDQTKEAVEAYYTWARVSCSKVN